ncbi:MAG: hypothetical protein MI757_18580, partial [Pirellulales bacterium]|nr:hypothetical protein [Pirellulales bacterium]
MPGESFGFWSVVPPLLAIGLAILTRRVVLSLFVAIFVGALILAGGSFGKAVIETCETFCWGSLSNPDHLRVFAFTLLMGAMVGVMHRSGGMHGLVASIAPIATNRRRGQLATWFGGLIVFFDDYANTLLLGSTMQPLADRLKISREKLAYIVDSTAAPIAGIAILSTWVATEVGYIASGFKQAGVADDSSQAFEIFLITIPYRFYPILALLFVGIIAWSRRDFGPMLAAERRAIEGISPQDQDEGIDDDGELNIDPEIPLRSINAVLPVLVVIAVVCALIYLTGRSRAAADAGLWKIIGSGDAYIAMMYGSLAGLLMAALLAKSQRIMTLGQIGEAAMAGGRLMLPALAILWLAWALADVTGKSSEAGVRLDTAGYLGSLVANVLSPVWLPTLIFLLASAVAFATGTSWGTMGILTPLTIEVTWNLLESAQGSVSPTDP